LFSFVGFKETFCYYSFYYRNHPKTRGERQLLRRYREIARNHKFMRLWVGLLVSNMGDRLAEFGLAWYVLGRTNNPLDVGLTLLIFQLPGLFSGILAGFFLDRFRRETIMIVDSLVRGGLVVLVPLLNDGPGLSLPVLYLIIALLGAFSVVTSVGSRTLITDYVPETDYNTANSLETLQNQLSGVLGPGLAGVLVGLLGPISLLWLDSLTFLFFALVLLTLRRQPPVIPTDEAPNAPGPAAPFWKNFFEGVTYTFRSPLLLALLSTSFLWNFALGIFQVALPFFCQGPLGVGAAGMGLLLAVNSVGSFLAALVFGPVRPAHPGRIVCLLLLAQAACYGLMGGLIFFPVSIVVSFCLGAFDDLAAIYLTTIRQRAVPKPLMGRVIAFTGTAGPSGVPLGSGLSGLLVAGFGPAWVVTFTALPLLFIGSLWLNLGPLRRVYDSGSVPGKAAANQG
jgi:MFS family permease